MRQYLNLLENILDNGVEKESGRANMPNTIGISHAVIQMDLQDGFPLLTTKKMYWKGIVHELLWFLRGDTNIKYLIDNNVHIWNSDAYRYFQDRLWLLPNIENITMDEFLNRTKEEKFEEKFHYKYGDLGPVYGHNWRNYNGKVDYYHTGKKPKIGLNDDNIFGVGITNTRKGIKKRPLFNTWYHMISRCYNYSDPNFSIYGGKGVYVSDEWLDFNTFEIEAKSILNYENKLNSPRKYQLDKDFSGGKCYSKENCIWLSIGENSRLITKNFEYTISNGEKEITTTNIEGTAKELGIEPTNLNRVCRGIRKSAGDWYLINKTDFRIGEDQIANILKQLKENPYSRYHILDGWNPIQRKISALAPCHLLYQFIVRPIEAYEREWLYAEKHGFSDEERYEMNPNASDEEVHKLMDEDNIPRFYLDLNMYQRSCDTFLGVPFNIASMSLLLEIFSKASGMISGIATWIGGDTHLYINHISVVEEQLKREQYPLPTMKINKELNSLDDILSLTINDFELLNYQSHPAIKAELFTGLKK
jgi:thymidylate synthase